MNKTIFFLDKHVTFSDSPRQNYDLIIDARSDANAELSRAKVVDFFEKYNSVLFLCNSPEESYNIFRQGFRSVEAAGGLVKNSSDQTLMILRNGRWDLPKGHLEEGESIEECAVREVEEETGISGIALTKKIITTQHTYLLKNEWMLKTTHWYAMLSDSLQTKAQSEEGIEQAKWCSPEEVAQNLQATYPTIKKVFEKANRY